MRISDGSSDGCSSALRVARLLRRAMAGRAGAIIVAETLVEERGLVERRRLDPDRVGLDGVRQREMQEPPGDRPVPAACADIVESRPGENGRASCRAIV